MLSIERKPFDHSISLLCGGRYLLRWTQYRNRGFGWYAEVHMTRRVDLAAAEKFAAKHGIAFPKQNVEA